MEVKLTVPVIIDDLNYELSGEITQDGFYVNTKIKDVDALIDRYFKEPDADDNDFIEILKFILPDELELGYKRSKTDDGSAIINTFILGGTYEWVKFYVYFDSYGTYFKLETNKSIDFNALPLVGDYLNEGYGISKLEFIYIPESYGKKASSNNDITKHIKFSSSSNEVLKRKINLLLEINLGTVKKHFVYHSIKDSETVQGEKKIDTASAGSDTAGQGQQPANSPSASNVQKQNATQQTPAKKSPVAFENITPEFDKEGIGLSITAGLNIAGFSFKLIGLGLKVPYTIFKEGNFLQKIDFSLKGMSLSYSNGVMLIEGVFIRKESQYGIEFNGALTLQFSKIGLSLIGSYIKTPEYNSLFAFGYLAIPIPIVPAFNIQGIAAGFGINRDFKAPDVKVIPEFPLIKMMEGEKIEDPEKAFDLLNSYLPPRQDSTILMAGLKFDSFKVVTTSAIVYAVINEDLNFGLLGLSKFAKPNIYSIQLAFSANYNVKVGLLKIEAALYKSYLFIPEISINGQMAFYLWFKDITNNPKYANAKAGDFVLTVGGYHPKYVKPNHYPTITQRLAVSFKLGSFVTISGGVYIALTPSCIMAGIAASLLFKKSLFQEGEKEVKKKKKWWQKILDFIIDIVKGLINIHVEVGLDFEADFLIYWNPFAYEAEISIKIYGKASITGLFNAAVDVSFGAMLSVYGPSFSGIATLEVLKYKIAIDFGKGRQTPVFTLAEFKKQYLIEDDKKSSDLLAFNVLKGVVKKVKKDNIEYVVVDPKIFELEVKSKVPCVSITDSRTKRKENLNDGKHLVKTIYPVHTGASILDSTLSILEGTSGDFTPSVIVEDLPKSIWSNDKPDFTQKINLNKTNDAFIKDIPLGLKFVFNQKAGKLKAVELKLYDTFKSQMEESKDVASYVVNADLVSVHDYLFDINGEKIILKDNLLESYKYKSIYTEYTVKRK